MIWAASSSQQLNTETVAVTFACFWSSLLLSTFLMSKNIKWYFIVQQEVLRLLQPNPLQQVEDYMWMYSFFFLYEFKKIDVYYDSVNYDSIVVDETWLEFYSTIW